MYGNTYRRKMFHFWKNVYQITFLFIFLVIKNPQNIIFIFEVDELMMFGSLSAKGMQRTKALALIPNQTNTPSALHAGIGSGLWNIKVLWIMQKLL